MMNTHLSGIYVRWRDGMSRIVSIFPAQPDTAAVIDADCMACGYPLNAGGQKLALLAIGPGDDYESTVRHREGRWYNAVALPFHVVCLGLPADVENT